MNQKKIIRVSYKGQMKKQKGKRGLRSSYWQNKLVKWLTSHSMLFLINYIIKKLDIMTLKVFYFYFDSHVKTILKLLVLWYPAVRKLFISLKFTINETYKFWYWYFAHSIKMLSGSLSCTNNVKSLHTLAESVWRSDEEILTRTKFKRYQFQP